MTYRDNRPSYNVNSKVANFKDFSDNIDCEDWKLKKMRNRTKPNSNDEQQHIGNQKWKYNKVSHKWDDISPELVDDKIDAIEELQESAKEKKKLSKEEIVKILKKELKEFEKDYDIEISVKPKKK